MQYTVTFQRSFFFNRTIRFWNTLANDVVAGSMRFSNEEISAKKLSFHFNFISSVVLPFSAKKPNKFHKIEKI